MKLLISQLKFCIFIALVSIPFNANAEYYLGDETISHVTFIDCHHHHCCFKTRHASHHRHSRHYRNNNIEKYCDQDMATGDDNACLHPDLQIN